MNLDGELYTADELNAQGYVLVWFVPPLSGKPDDATVGSIIKHPGGGPDHVVARILNRYQAAVIPWYDVPGMADTTQ